MAKGLRAFPRGEANFRKNPSREAGAEGTNPCGLTGRRGDAPPAFFALFFFLATVGLFQRAVHCRVSNLQEL